MLEPLTNLLTGSTPTASIVGIYQKHGGSSIHQHSWTAGEHPPAESAAMLERAREFLSETRSKGLTTESELRGELGDAGAVKAAALQAAARAALQAMDEADLRVKSGGFCLCDSVWHVAAKRDEVLRYFALLGEMLKAAGTVPKPKLSDAKGVHGDVSRRLSSVGAALASIVPPELSLFGKPAKTSLAALAGEVLQRFDANGDGVLSRDEFHQFVAQALPKHASAGEALYKAVDRDGDGTVGINELRAFLRVYDPDAPAAAVPRKSALIIVDVQNDFVSGTLANPFGAHAIVPLINEMRDAFDLVVISLDWHPHDHCSFVETANAGQLRLASDPAKVS